MCLSIGYTRVEFLGHEVVAGKGVAVRDAKVKAIVQCERPQSAKDIKTFLGMSGFFRKFIPNYAEIASPLRALEKQVRTVTTPITYEWQKKHQRCFDAIKAALINADTLAAPDYSKPFNFCYLLMSPIVSLGQPLSKLTMREKQDQ